jgi:GTP-binding protein
VEDTPGVTRDRQYGVSEWNGKTFNIIDTGGFVPFGVEIFEKEIREQVMIAVEEANAIIFMTDVTTGITTLDEAMTDILRVSKKPVFLAVNKVDNNARQLDATEFYALGFEHTHFLSSMSGSGTGELLDDIASLIDADVELPDENLPRIAIIGQPNVGKSSLLNAMVGTERTIVSEIAGTTRDTIHTHYNLFQKELILIDTAGIRRKTKVHEDIEFYSVIRAIKAVDEADVCLMMIDAEKGIAQQDLNIFSLAVKKGKGIVFLVNKWDTVEKATNTAKDYEKELKARLAPFTDIPVLFISAKEKTRVFKVVETALEVYESRKRRIQTSVLNEEMLPVIEAYHPPVVRGNSVKIKFITQLPTAVPSFAFFTNYPDDIKAPYRNYLENKLREKFNFKGVPVRIFFRKK